MSGPAGGPAPGRTDGREGGPGRRPFVLIPGPTPVDERILAALAEPTRGHNEAPFVATFRACLERLRRLLSAELALVVGGAGTLSMEMALCNSLGDGDELLVVSHGVFGDRFAAIARAHGWRCDVLSAEPGAAAAPDELARRLAGGRYRAVTVTHVDTSTGVLAPVEAYAPIVRRAGALLVLDGVCATGALPEPMEALGVDHLVTTSQKALGVPPGLTILGLSRRALARREELPRVPAYYADLANWVPIMRDPGGYFSTPPVNAVVALDRALAIIEEEGFEARHERHRRFAAAFRAGLAALGLETLTRADCLAPTLSVVRYPEGVDDGAFRAAAEAAGALFAGGVGPLRGRVFRVGHMGNIGRAELLTAIAAVEAGLSAAGHRVQPGLGVAAVQAALLR